MKEQGSNLAILGPGLLGGSVALAARAYNYADSVRIWARRKEAAESVDEMGIADFASEDLGKVIAGADLIVLATPVGAMPDLVSRLLDLKLAEDVVITDLGSVKGCVVESIDPLLAGRDDLRFVGSHPMAGKELTGIEHATADLFQGAACVITPGASSCDRSTARVENFWQQLGCRTLQMEPAEHDSAVAKVSHLPHLAASLVVSAALGEDPSIGGLAGGGLRDTTRVAAGAADMWAEILIENREAIAPALENLSARLDEAKQLIAAADHEKLRAVLKEAKGLRDQLKD